MLKYKKLRKSNFHNTYTKRKKKYKFTEKSTEFIVN